MIQHIPFKLIGLFAAVILAVGAIAYYDDTLNHEVGFRGVGMWQDESVDRLANLADQNALPPQIPQGSMEGNLAVNQYENVQVLGHLSVANFGTLMATLNQWVAPKDGPIENRNCGYCHNVANFASDEKYPKVVTRRMFQMTWHINSQWQRHVGNTGVTCWTCHRGQPVPNYRWNLEEEGPQRGQGMLGYMQEQNQANWYAGLSSLPNTALQSYLLDDMNVRVQGQEIYPGHRSSIKQTEWTYSLMMHFSNSLGVNCTYCHNSRRWSSWEQSPLTRTTAWHGIRMVRNLNNTYIASIDGVVPREGAYTSHQRYGPMDDLAKVNCATCHQGAYKPLLGQQMLAQYPVLRASVPQPDPDPDDVRIENGRIQFDGKIQFRLGSAEVLPASDELLDHIATLAKNHAYEIGGLRVAGHTDLQGDARQNFFLSEERASAVVAELRERGVEVPIGSLGYGTLEPTCTDDTPACHRQNRRVEMVIVQEGEALVPADAPEAPPEAVEDGEALEGDAAPE